MDIIWNSKKLESKPRWNIHAVSQSNLNVWRAVSHTKCPKTHMDNKAKNIGNQLHYNFVLISSMILSISSALAMELL